MLWYIQLQMIEKQSFTNMETHINLYLVSFI